MSGYINIVLVNDDPFGNNVKVWDRRDSNRIIFDGYLNGDDGSSSGNNRLPLDIRESGGYGSIATSKDGNPAVGHDWLRNNDVVNL